MYDWTVLELLYKLGKILLNFDYFGLYVKNPGQSHSFCKKKITKVFFFII